MLNPERPRDHITIPGAPQISTYTAISGWGSAPEIRERTRNEHGNKIREKLSEVESLSDRLKGKTLPENITRDEGTYVEFYSHIEYDLMANSLHRTRSGIELLNAVKIPVIDPDSGEKKYLTKAVVYIPDGKIDIFIRMVERYLTEEYGDTDKPKNKNFIESIEDIKIATLKSFWTDTLEFPDDSENIWWEVWIRTHAEKEKYEVTSVDTVITQAQNIGLTVSPEILEFPEHKIVLVKGSAKRLSKSLLLLNNLAEVRKAKTRADFFTEFIAGWEQEGWIDDLIERVEVNNENGPSICLLDSGVRNGHRLLEQLIPDANLDTYKQVWGTDDTASGSGHGTLMAGIALFGDLAHVLASPNPINIYHNIESVKIVEESDPNIPQNYGAITEECVARSYVMNPDSNKVFCMAVTTKDFRDLGQPSSWSSAIDKIVFGDQENESPKLFLISGGNVYITNPDEYPDKNLTDQIHDPGQCWNALTIGSFTQKSDVNTHKYPGHFPVAQSGQMAPTNSTSLVWENDWPYKPDVVFEGGNIAGNDNGDIVYDDALQMLSTSKNIRIKPLAPFGATRSLSD